MQLNERFGANAKIKRFVEEKFGYDLGMRLEDIRDDYHFDVTCQGSVPIAIMAFLQRPNALDSLRFAISMGGDSDTIGAICGAVAGAFYGVPDDIRAKAETFLTPHLLEALHGFERMLVQDSAMRGGADAEGKRGE